MRFQRPPAQRDDVRMLQQKDRIGDTAGHPAFVELSLPGERPGVTHGPKPTGVHDVDHFRSITVDSPWFRRVFGVVRTT